MFWRSLPILLLLAISACDRQLTWTPEEIRNARQIFTAIEAGNAAARLANEYETEPDEARREALLTELRRAYVNASQVSDHVLDKLHPQMYSKFRLRFQSGLGKLLNYYEAPDRGARADAVDQIREFHEWYQAHQAELRLWRE